MPARNTPKRQNTHRTNTSTICALPCRTRSRLQPPRPHSAVVPSCTTSSTLPMFPSRYALLRAGLRPRSAHRPQTDSMKPSKAELQPATVWLLSQFWRQQRPPIPRVSLLGCTPNPVELYLRKHCPSSMESHASLLLSFGAHLGRVRQPRHPPPCTACCTSWCDCWLPVSGHHREMLLGALWLYSISPSLNRLPGRITLRTHLSSYRRKRYNRDFSMVEMALP